MRTTEEQNPKIRKNTEKESGRNRIKRFELIGRALHPGPPKGQEKSRKIPTDCEFREREWKTKRQTLTKREKRGEGGIYGSKEAGQSLLAGGKIGFRRTVFQHTKKKKRYKGGGIKRGKKEF